MRLAGTTVLLVAAALVACGNAAPEDLGCWCPARAGSWLLFEDSNTRTPDFWWKDEVVVDEISFCPHGIHFVFIADDHGTTYLTALVFNHPLEGLGRRPCTRRIAEADDKYVRLRRELDRMFGGALERYGRIDLHDLAFDDRPRIVEPWRCMVLRWGGETVELRGNLDVYMTLMP